MGIATRGFTLAEVLITLGVIGVVAAVTMPTLITKCPNYKYNLVVAKGYISQYFE